MLLATIPTQIKCCEEAIENAEINIRSLFKQMSEVYERLERIEKSLPSAEQDTAETEREDAQVSLEREFVRLAEQHEREAECNLTADALRREVDEAVKVLERLGKVDESDNS